MNHPTVISRLFASLCNRLLENQPGVARALALHSPSVFSVEVRPVRLAFHIEPDGRLVAADPALASTVIVVHPFNAMLAHAGVTTPAQAFLVSGSDTLAYAFSGLFEELDWQAEEALSNIFGPIFAAEFIKAAQGFVRWQKETVRRSLGLVASYVIERQVLPSSREVAAFIKEVDVFRDRLARLEKRLEKLYQRSYGDVGTT
ncbi:MAG: hypothetical protein KGQ58_01460 [Proteobacteria bacterium]|nr:hypothetical protein [Pseudomonadota bacterium]